MILIVRLIAIKIFTWCATLLVTSDGLMMNVSSDGPVVNSQRLSAVPSPAELIALQRHLLTLSEHVKRLELENSRRWRRELLLYPLLFGYVIMRLARWIISSKWVVSSSLVYVI